MSGSVPAYGPHRLERRIDFEVPGPGPRCPDGSDARERPGQVPHRGSEPLPDVAVWTCPDPRARWLRILDNPAAPLVEGTGAEAIESPTRLQRRTSSGHVPTVRVTVGTPRPDGSGLSGQNP